MTGDYSDRLVYSMKPNRKNDKNKLKVKPTNCMKRKQSILAVWRIPAVYGVKDLWNQVILSKE